MQICLTGQLSFPILRPLIKTIRSSGENLDFNALGSWGLATSDELESLDVKTTQFPDIRKGLNSPNVAGEQFPKVLEKRPSKKKFGTSFKKNIKSRIDLAIHSREISRFLNEFDIIHLHSISIGRATRFLGANISHPPLVTSIWGSDLFRVSDPKVIDQQKKIISKSTIVTVTTPEMKDRVIERFGESTRKKIRHTFFEPQIDYLFEENARMWTDPQKAKLDIDQEKKILCIGHNGNKHGQHLSLIGGLKSMTSNEIDQIFVICPMTYGGTEEYKLKAADSLKALGVDYLILDKFLDRKELASLRLSTDIFLYAPTTDAFSATVSQALAAGSVNVLGSWLPYRLRKEAGFHYLDFDLPEDSGNAISKVLDNWDEHSTLSKFNKELSLEFFQQKKIADGWITAYHDCKSVFNNR